jgi:predicted Zn-dependent protease
MNTRRYLFAMGLVWAVIIAACASAPYTDRSQFIIVPASQEVAMGAQAAQDVKKKEHVSTDKAALDLVRRVGARISRVAERPDYKWEFSVIEKNELNAFCLPGGKVFFYTGLLELTGSDDEVAAVMGHEVGHALARHGAERMSVSMAAQLGGQVASTAIGLQNPAVAQLFNTAYGVGSQVGVLLPFSREQESEADYLGLILMTKAGYDPGAALSFWKKMAAKNKGKATPAWLSTHPANEDRIAAIQKDLDFVRKRYAPPQ